MLEIRPIGTANLPDAARLCLSGESLSDRPRGFTREIETDCSRCKLAYLRDQFRKGSKALAAYRFGMLVGYLEYHPVAHAPVPVDGEDVFVVTCLRVPEESERIDVEPALLEEAARLWTEAGARGGAVLAREKDWTRMGFEEIVRTADAYLGDERVLWFRRTGEGDAPRIVEVDRNLPRMPGKTRVDLFVSERCPWDKFVFDMVRGVCESLPDSVVLYETDMSRRREVLRAGVGSAIAVNGEFQPWLRPHTLVDEHTARRRIEDA